jgi:hypothetical protein
VYHACSAVVRRITLFSFVVVTLYVVGALVYPPMSFNADTPMPLMRFGMVALAWCQYVLFASVLKKP